MKKFKKQTVGQRYFVHHVRRVKYPDNYQEGTDGYLQACSRAEEVGEEHPPYGLTFVTGTHSRTEASLKNASWFASNVLVKIMS